MKLIKFAAIAVLSLAQVTSAAAMSQSYPVKFNFPWATNAGTPYVRAIPQNSQIGIQNCAASVTDGFPPLTFIPATAGGCPPFGQDMNGILRQITQWTITSQVKGGLPWDVAFSSAIGGYPKGAVVESNILPGRLWYSTADNNTANPDAAAAPSGWTVLPGTNSPGTLIAIMSSGFQPPNTVQANGLTVGNGSSNATNRANADTFWLFSFLWSSCSNCTLFNSSGGVVTRGATAAADFALNYAVATPQMGGAGITGVDTTTSFLVGVPVQSGSRTVPGSVLGENLHTLTGSEIPSHTHPNFLSDPGHVHGNTLTDPGHTHPNTGAILGGNAAGGAPGGAIDVIQQHSGISFGAAFTGITINNVAAITGISLTNGAFGGGGSHNTVARSVLVYWYLAL